MTDLNKILPIVLAVLVLVSAVQAYQLNSLKGKLEAGTVTAAPLATAKGVAASGTGSAVASSGGGSGGATSVSDLPSMVGGC